MIQKSILRPVLASLFLIGVMAVGYTQVSSESSLLASVFDGEGLVGGLEEAREEIETEETGIRTEDDIVHAIADIINFVLLFAGIFAVVAFVVSGFMFILGFGSDSSIQRARKIMIWAAVGLVVIIFAFVLVDFIVDLATAGDSGGQ